MLDILVQKIYSNDRRMDSNNIRKGIFSGYIYKNNLIYQEILVVYKLYKDIHICNVEQAAKLDVFCIEDKDISTIILINIITTHRHCFQSNT
jgi:hypothetical protein